MLAFNKLGLEDISKVRKYFPYSVNRSCDNSVGGAFMWRDYFTVEYAEYNDTIIFKAQIKYFNNIKAFSVPIGADVRGSIDMVAEYCRLNGIPVAFCTVTNDDIKILRTVFDEYRLYKEADWSDYVYNAADLVTLSGRRYNGQRNHINHFKRTYDDYSFELFSNANIESVREFYSRLSLYRDLSSEVAAEDHNKTIEVLDNFETYGLLGGLLRANGSVIAFSIGEKINNVLFIHVEKADLQYRGAYQVINNEFAKHFSSSEIKFINREEDVGDEGLRVSKKSYHPCEIIDKYIFLTPQVV